MDYSIVWKLSCGKVEENSNWFVNGVLKDEIQDGGITERLSCTFSEIVVKITAFSPASCLVFSLEFLEFYCRHLPRK